MLPKAGSDGYHRVRIVDLGPDDYGGWADQAHALTLGAGGLPGTLEYEGEVDVFSFEADPGTWHSAIVEVGDSDDTHLLVRFTTPTASPCFPRPTPPPPASPAPTSTWAPWTAAPTT